jgi:putative ABC transport system permease protein
MKSGMRSIGLSAYAATAAASAFAYQGTRGSRAAIHTATTSMLMALAHRNLKRRPARSILTALGVALAVGSFITLYGLSGSVYQNLEQSIEEHGADLTIRRHGTAELFGGTIPESVAARIAKISGVLAVSGELLSLAATDSDDHVLATGWSEDSFFWQNVPLEEGRLPSPGERKVALMGIDLARALQKHAGDTINLLGEPFLIVGITRFSSVINRNVVVVALTDLQEVTFRSGAITFLSVKLAHPEDPAEVDRIAKAIEATGDLSASKSENVLRNDSMLGLLRAVSSSMAWVALLMGVLMVLNTLLMAVLERTREIGILSAIGWSTERIMAALVIEGFFMSAVGSAVGIVFGVAGSHLLTAIPAIGRYVAVRPTPALVAATALAAVGLGILGSFYPAWLATRQSPAIAFGRA